LKDKGDNNVSRKWERMVEKNRNSLNKVRRKRGQAALSEGITSKEKLTVIKGRSWMLPSVLVLFAGLYFFTTYQVAKMDGAYWFTGLSYIGLAILVYLVRRPVIKISHNYLTVRRFTGEKFIEPKDIEEMDLNTSHIVIQLKDKRKKIIYTKLQHQFPMEELAAKLREFAVQHKISLKDETR
jgi:hypothetical protein